MFCKSGPFHHKSLAASSFTSSPRERTSAGLTSDEICFHWKSLDNCWICDTRLPAKVLSWFGGPELLRKNFSFGNDRTKKSKWIVNAYDLGQDALFGIAVIKTDVGFLSKGIIYTVQNHAQSLYLDFFRISVKWKFFLRSGWRKKGSCTTYAASFLLFEEAVLILTEGFQIPFIQKNPRDNRPCKSPEGESLKPME
ncbi:uncharacterized protein TNIN_146251 [Trichonephila inaurata madagascariensis]|uniref:Uncharacterized protein n=1 Tax=Trichonephila inaurata madagascariensis TaxID=2747483 RepID=A0A8X6YU94_9ARAC|nr:uncharacterized protein TNIN_146251 [Trichonephila inaurata madagascariensis]